VATVLMVGESSCALAGGFLRLGAVVVIAPSEGVLRAWQHHGQIPAPPPTASEGSAGGPDAEGIHVDLRAHAIGWAGRELDLTELEYRVLAALAGEPGVAWTFRELRLAGWGSSHDSLDDVMPVRSVVQRVRGKLAAAGASAGVESVRGYGFRLRSGAAEAAAVAPVLHASSPGAS